MAVILVAGVALAVWLVRSRREHVSGHAFALPPVERRIVVEVLNGSGRPGLARTATRVLRRQGIDVVSFGNGPATDSTVILLRRGDPAALEAVRERLGQGAARTELDATRLVDVTVLLGGNYRGPAELHP